MQGSGKGTQGKLLAEKYNLKVFDMGSELRSIKKSNSPLSEKIQSIINTGNLVDDDTIMDIVENFLNNTKSDQSVLFDGIPRTLIQSNKLIKLLDSHNRNAFAVFIKISEDEAFKRVSSRRICSNCNAIYPAEYVGNNCKYCNAPLIVRDDDNLESIKKRIEVYKKETMPVINSFYNSDHLIEVDGEMSIDKVSKEVIEKVDYLFM